MSKIRFYDAVVKGCEIAPEQEFGSLGHDKSTCVNGAAFLATHGAREYCLYAHPGTPDCFSFMKQNVGCPECELPDSFETNVLGINVHLNDVHCWDRVRIALWASQFEPEPEASEIEKWAKLAAAGRVL